ncbi:MAG TPA: GNAT family N-acetyltransferase [Candidatus Dojkabacteria bacterium]|nr:GNAT family N-acetyltransferase [Candidatus Dojkabacteria bacterium]
MTEFKREGDGYFAFAIIKEPLRDLDANIAEKMGLFNPKTDAWFDNIEVDPEKRGQGIARRILNELIDDCYDKEVLKIVGVFSPNDPYDDDSSLAALLHMGAVPSEFGNDVLLTFDLKYPRLTSRY